MNKAWERPCLNCHQPTAKLFCCLDCAEERYALTHDALTTAERQKHELREALRDLTQAALDAQKVDHPAAAASTAVGPTSHTPGEQGTLLSMPHFGTAGAANIPGGIDPPVPGE